MKRNIIIILILALAVSAFAGCSANQETQAADTAAAEQTDGEYDYGAITALEKDELTIEQMLSYAIQDEYLARQEYELIMEEYGEQAPFSNIIKAEETHIELLKDIYDEYGYDMPQDTAIEYAVVPSSLEVAFDVGVQAEIDNIAMYEKFLESELPDDIRDVFIELRDASENHLAAFERGVRGGGRGRN